MQNNAHATTDRVATKKHSELIASRQFSVRSLFTLTFVVATCLTVSILSRGSDYLRAFASPWWIISSLPVVLIGLLSRNRLLARRGMASLALALFATSLALPALSIEVFRGPGTLWGWLAFAGTFTAVPEILTQLATEGFKDDALGVILYLVGALANVFLIYSFVHFAIAVWRRRSLLLPRRVAIAAAVCVFVDLVLLLQTGDVYLFYPGYGCWFASPVALALAARDYPMVA
jgi:hypothetical protein